MAETSGFQLSQFDRAPQISSNVGVVDTKSIYASVVDALRAHEAIRTTQSVQRLSDATTAYQTAQAQGLLSNLPDTLAADKAKSQLLSLEAIEGLRGVTPQINSQIAKNVLSSALDTATVPLVPDRIAAEKAKLSSEKVISEITADPVIARQLVIAKTLGTGTNASRQKAIYDLENPNSTEFSRQAAAIYLGLNPKAVTPGIGYQVLTDSNGSTRLVATNKYAPGAMDVLTGQVIGVAPGTRPTMAPTQLSLLPAATAPTATVPTAPTAPTATATAPAATAPTATATAPTATAPTATAPTATAPTVPAATAPYIANGVNFGSFLGQSTAEKVSEKDISQVKSEWLKKLPALEGIIRNMETKIKSNGKTLDEAQQRLSIWNTGLGGQLLRNFGGMSAHDLEEFLKPVRVNIFTDELAQMRANSPTGGAIGNVTDVEGEKFEATLGSLKITQSKGQLIDTIDRIRMARREMLENLKATLNDYRRYLNGYGVSPFLPLSPESSAADDLVKLYSGSPNP